MARLTATDALRQSYAIVDLLVQADAVKLLMLDGYDEQAARRAVAAAFKERFAVSGVG